MSILVANKVYRYFFSAAVAGIPDLSTNRCVE